ncbi:hypothetical protein MPSYJ_16870 [Mycolicibacterium psychrotolerans]|uniref:Uncharacterized protein n=1 Tax=Mycolicibacterium psychrotolerans TaxID=216929 RepID=A0A7I7M887_9MYCO|nr:hypothetical protein MPSYJ_16870 [Mycolicibacterium psychrotolerans]
MGNLGQDLTMGSALCIGRVGGLAVALGVGMAVAASTGVAWADDSATASSESASSAGATDHGKSSDSDSTRPGRGSGESEGEDSGSDDPAGPVVHSAAVDREVSGGVGKSDRPRNRKLRATRVLVGADSDTSGSAPSGGDTSVRQHAIADRALEQPAAPRTVVAVTTGTSALLGPDVVAQQEVSVSSAESTPGPGSSMTDGPLLPVDSPLELVVAALGTRQRSAGAALTGQSVESGQTSVAAMAAPIVPGQPIGIPDPVTGVVNGTVVVTDPESDTLTFALATEPDGGKVQLNAQTGAYTYAPSQTARLAAGATTTTDTDTFSVTVGDGQQTSTAVVSVYIAPARLDTKPPIAVGSRPSAMVVTSDGRLFVANTGGNTVSVINTVTGQRVDANSSIFSKDISVGSAPGALALSANGLWLYVANTGDRTVSVIDTATYKRIDANPSIFSTRISVGSSPSALAVSSNRLYVANRGSNTVSVIDTTTNKLVDINPNVSGNQSISVGSAPSALVSIGKRLYVANRSSNTLSVVNTDTESIVTTIAVGAQPSSLALGTNGRLYVVNTGSGTVSVINTATNAPAPFDPNGRGANPITVGPSPSSVALSPLGDLAYVVNGNDTISVIDTEAFRVIRTEAIDSDPSGDHVIAVTPNGTIYVTDAADRTVRVLAITPGSAASVARTEVDLIGDNVSLTGYLNGKVFTPDGTRLVITTDATNYDLGGGATKVAVINTATAKQIGTTLTLAGGESGTPLLNADGTRAIITIGGWTTQVVVIDTTTGAQVGNTFTLAGEVGFPTVLSSDGSRALVSTASSDLVTGGTRMAVLDTKTGAQIGTTLTLPGYQSATWSADATHVLVTTMEGDWETGFTTRVVVVDATTHQASTTLSLAGRLLGSPLFSAKGTRALVVTDADASTSVAVFNPVTGSQVGTTLTLAGTQSVVMSADANRALIVTSVDDTVTPASTTLVTIVDATTGKQVGSTVTLIGAQSGPARAAGAGRALVTTYVADGYTVLNTQVTVIDTTTAAKIGTTATLTGRADGEPLVSADGTRALITNNAGVAVIINTATGAQVGPALSLTGRPAAFQLAGADGNRALITTTVTGYERIEYTTRVTVFNTTTGAQVGTTLTVPGSGAPLMTADGTRALISTAVYDQGALFWVDPHSTRVAVIDTTTGQQIGATLTLYGGIYGAQLLSAESTRALITTSPWNPVTYTGTSRMVVVDMMTGKQAGGTLSIGGGADYEPLFSADGTRVVFTTNRLISFPYSSPSDTATRVAVLGIS